MNTMLDNFINGNLTDAKRQAKRHGLRAICDTLRESYGYSQNKAFVTACYLKGQATFQEACDAV